jgi:squalene-associated FAD-dependent desaturase
VAAPRVAVAGGGLAGLAAAAELNDRGCEVHLFERSRLLGGRATSFEVDGRTVDNGQHVYLACCTEFIDFVQRTGLRDALYLQDRFDVAVYAGGVRSELRAGDLPPPWQLLGSLVAYRHLSLSGKLRLARALLALRRDKNPAGTFDAWLRAHGQDTGTIRAFWEPFMVPALNAPLDRMSAAEAAFVIRTAFLEDRDAARFGYARVPLAEIMEAAAQKLDRVYRSTAVAAVDASGESVAVRLAGGAEERFDAVVLALPPRALERVIGEPHRFGLPDLSAYEASAIMDVHLWHDRGRLSFDFCALLDSPVQWIFQKADGYLCCSLSAAGALVTTPTGDVVAHVWTEVCKALPELAQGRLLRGAATRNPEGTYNARPGAVRPGTRTRDPKVTIAGSWTATGWPDTMESAVRSGRDAARALIEQNAWKTDI